MVWFYQGSDRQSYKSFWQLSIPLWSDFIEVMKVEITEIVDKFFQSHYGLILSLASLTAVFGSELAFNPTMVWFYQFTEKRWTSSTSLLSIPLWSDFIKAMELNLKEKEAFFQSHYGLILSAVRALEKVWIIFFQSHYGLILSFLQAANRYSVY